MRTIESLLNEALADKARLEKEVGALKESRIGESGRFVEIAEGAPDRTPGKDAKLKLKESAMKAFGLSESQAEVFAGIKTDRLAEAVMRGDTAPDFWQKLKEFKG